MFIGQTAQVWERRLLTLHLTIAQFLMDAKLAIPLPKKYSYQQGAAIGVGTEVSSPDAMLKKSMSSQQNRLLLWGYSEGWESSFQIPRHCPKLKTSGLLFSEEREV